VDALPNALNGLGCDKLTDNRIIIIADLLSKKHIEVFRDLFCVATIFTFKTRYIDKFLAGLSFKLTPDMKVSRLANGSFCNASFTVP